MPDDDPCKEEPCKSALEAYQNQTQLGREALAKVKMECAKRNAMRDLLMRLTIVWVALLAAAIICMALIEPNAFCNAIVMAFYLVSALLSVGFARLLTFYFYVDALSRACNHHDLQKGLAYQEARRQCPARCVPEHTYLEGCDCP